MGLQLELDRKRFEDLLNQIKNFTIEGTSVTSMEELHLKNIKNEAEYLLRGIEPNSEFLNAMIKK